jgi:hypothetical protein
MAQRFRLLWHPLSIVAGAGIVSVVISVLGDLPFNSGRAGVPAQTSACTASSGKSGEFYVPTFRKSPYRYHFKFNARRASPPAPQPAASPANALLLSQRKNAILPVGTPIEQ